MARKHKKNGRENADRPDHRRKHRRLILACIVTLLAVLAAVAFLLWYLETDRTGQEIPNAVSGGGIVAELVENPADQLCALLRDGDLQGAEILYERSVRGNAAQEKRVDEALCAAYDSIVEKVRSENYPRTTAIEHIENMLPFVKDENIRVFLSDWIRSAAAKPSGETAAAEVYERLHTQFQMENTYFPYPDEYFYSSLIYVQGVPPVLDEGRHATPSLRIVWDEQQPDVQFRLQVGDAAFTDYGLDVIACRSETGSDSVSANEGHRTITRFGARDVGWMELMHQEPDATIFNLPDEAGVVRTDLAPWAACLAAPDGALVFSGGGRETVCPLTQEEREAVASLWSLYKEIRDTPGMLGSLYRVHDEQWIADFELNVGDKT